MLKKTNETKSKSTWPPMKLTFMRSKYRIQVINVVSLLIKIRGYYKNHGSQYSPALSKLLYSAPARSGVGIARINKTCRDLLSSVNPLNKTIEQASKKRL